MVNWSGTLKYHHNCIIKIKLIRGYPSSFAYENCSRPMVQHYCHGATIFTHPIAVRIRTEPLVKHLWCPHHSYAYGCTMSTALGRDYNSQVLISTGNFGLYAFPARPFSNSQAGVQAFILLAGPIIHEFYRVSSKSDNFEIFTLCWYIFVSLLTP